MTTCRLYASAMILGLAGLTGCASTPETAPERPAWIDNPSEAYASSLYVTGLGEGDSADRARDRARADLAKAFEVAVEAQSVDIETYGHIGPEGAEGGQLDRRIEREIRTRTDLVLAGVEIVESWQDRADDTHYALAAMAKPRAANRLRAQIRALDNETVAYIEEAGALDDPLRRLRLLDQAIERQVRREALNRQLRVVDPGGSGLTSPAPLGEIAAEYRRTASALRFTTRAVGMAREEIGAALATAVADAGFGRAQGGSDYELVVRFDIDDIGQRADWYWYRGHLRLVVRAANGTIHASDQWDVRGSATDQATAWRRTVREAGTGLDRRLHATLLAPAD